jgi:hypothetical protein
VKIVDIAGREFEIEAFRLAPRSLIELAEALIAKFERETFEIQTFGSPLDLMIGQFANSVTSSAMGDQQKFNQIREIQQDIERLSQWISAEDIISCSDIDSVTGVGPEIDFNHLYPMRNGFLSKKPYFSGISTSQEQKIRIEMRMLSRDYVANPNQSIIGFKTEGKEIFIEKFNIIYLC